MNSHELIETFIQITHQNINAVTNFKSFSVKKLNFRPTPTSWNILECVEHLNRYGNFYIPEISKRIAKTKTTHDPVFKSGFVGSYFVKSLRPIRKVKRMKTFKSMNPLGEEMDVSTLDTFLQQQKAMLQILESCKHVNLTKVKTNISISKWIKLRLGNTLEVVIYHNQRHVLQCAKIVDNFS